MTEPLFHILSAPLDLTRLLALTGARHEIRDGAPGPHEVAIAGLGPLDRAGPRDLALAADARQALDLAGTQAGACLTRPEFLDQVPARTLALVSDEPVRAFARAARAMFPAAARPDPLFGPGVAAGAVVHPDARLEPDVCVDPGAVVGPRAEIGRGAIIGANAVVGPGVRIGRGSTVGHGAVVTDALVGDRVQIGPGARLGHAAPAGPDDAASVGRVVAQDDVVIGANVSVARGRLHDTVIGEKSLVGDLASVGAGSMVGRACVIVPHARLGDAAVLPDFTAFFDAPGDVPAADGQGTPPK